MQLSAGIVQNYQNKTLKKLLLYISALLVAAYVVAAFFWTDSFAGEARCKRMYVYVAEDDTAKFVTTDFVVGELKRMGFNVEGKKLSDIDTEEIEKAFQKMDYVEEAQCYALGNDAILLDVVPIRPVLRVFGKDGSYYVNKQGKRVAANAKFYVNLPVVAGDFTDDFPPVRLLPMMEYIEHDAFLRDLVSAVEVRDSNNIFIVPNIAGHVVNMGSVEGYQSKFAKLLRMYREVLPVKGWDAYDTINVKWDYQIVAVKRNGKSRLNIAQFDAEVDEAAPDISTVTADDAKAPSSEKPESSLEKPDAKSQISNAFKKTKKGN